MRVIPAAVTQPFIKLEDGSRALTADEFIVYCARVSNPSNQLNVETAPRLLAFCIRKNHWSIFDQATLTLEIQTSRAISAQIARHWSFRFQEFSQRYSPVTAFEEVELRQKADSNRQGSGEVFDPILYPHDQALAIRASDWVAAHMEESKDLYAELLKEGVAPECARMVLPMCVQTTLYMTGSVRSWIHYFMQRTDTHAQKEHRILATEAKRIFDEIFPDTSAAVRLYLEESKSAH